MAYIVKTEFFSDLTVIQQDWIAQWIELESWLNQYTPGWSYVGNDHAYFIEFMRESDLTLYHLRWSK